MVKNTRTKSVSVDRGETNEHAEAREGFPLASACRKRVLAGESAGAGRLTLGGDTPRRRAATAGATDPLLLLLGHRGGGLEGTSADR